MLAGLVITRDVTRPNRRFPFLWTSGENRDKDQSEKVDFRDKAGQEHEEECTISSFYYFFLELYGKRGLMQRNGVAQE